jgi:hypothetical protein
MYGFFQPPFASRSASDLIVFYQPVSSFDADISPAAACVVVLFIPFGPGIKRNGNIGANRELVCNPVLDVAVHFIPEVCHIQSRLRNCRITPHEMFAIFVGVVQAQTKSPFCPVFGPTEAGNAGPRSPTPRSNLGLSQCLGNNKRDTHAPQEKHTKEPRFMQEF